MAESSSIDDVLAEDGRSDPTSESDVESDSTGSEEDIMDWLA